MRSITFYLCFIPILALLLLMINLIFAPHSPYQEKSSIFECGFHSFMGQNRTQFSISFFIYGLLFLLFDLELLLVYPYVSSSYINDTYGFFFMVVFFMILTVGFAFELGKKALNIDTKVTNKSNVQRNKVIHSQIFAYSFFKKWTVATSVCIQIIAYIIIAIVLPRSGELIVACAKISKRDSWSKKLHRLNTLTIRLFKYIVRSNSFAKLYRFLITVNKAVIRLTKSLLCKLYRFCKKKICSQTFIACCFFLLYIFFYMIYNWYTALLCTYYSCSLLYFYCRLPKNIPFTLYHNIYCKIHIYICKKPIYFIIIYYIFCLFLQIVLLIFLLY